MLVKRLQSGLMYVEAHDKLGKRLKQLKTANIVPLLYYFEL